MTEVKKYIDRDEVIVRMGELKEKWFEEDGFPKENKILIEIITSCMAQVVYNTPIKYVTFDDGLPVEADLLMGGGNDE